MTFPSSVERWRGAARTWSAWAAELNHVALDESDVLALILRESGGNPTIVSPTGYRGLGQIGVAALTDYNNAQSEPYQVPLAWLTDAAHGSEQVRVVAWHLARGRTIVAAWGMPDAVSNAGLWCDARYGWGAGNLRSAIKRFEAANGRLPTFDELAAAEPNAGWSERRQKFNVRPWVHARANQRVAAADRALQKKNPAETIANAETAGDIGAPAIPWAAFALGGLGAILVAFGMGFAYVRHTFSKTDRSS